jgi:hypothetical protein
VPILGTLGTYVGLAYHDVSPLVLTVDVENVPSGATLQGGAIVWALPWHWSRYGAAFDYLFGVDLPPFDARTAFSNQLHSQFRFAAGRLSLQNWQPRLDRVFVGIEDESQRKAALVLLRVKPAFDHAGTIRVTHQLLERCYPPEDTTGGACLIQVAHQSEDEREVRVVFDLARINLEPYKDVPFHNVKYLWGPEGQ